MPIQSERPSSIPARFKFEGSGPLLIAWILLLGVFTLPLILTEETRHGPIHFGELIYMAFTVFFIFLLIFTVKSGADIIIDEEAISRCRFGWTLQKIRWDNIQLIRSRPYYHPARRRIVKVISIFPLKKRILRMSPSGLMSFSDQAKSADKLMHFINNYSAQHKIKIEISENGTARVATSL